MSNGRRAGRAMLAAFVGWLGSSVWHQYAVEFAHVGTVNGIPPAKDVVLATTAIGLGITTGAAWALCARLWPEGLGWRVPLVAVALFGLETGFSLLLSLVSDDRVGVAIFGSVPIALVLYFAIRRPGVPRRPARSSPRAATAGEHTGPTRLHDAQETDPADIVRTAARSGARAVTPALEARLRRHYGVDWLARVNSARGAGHRARGLRDHRFCLSTLANDPATDGWATAHVRRDARRLCALSNAVTHDEPCGTREADEARALAARLIAADLDARR